MIKIRQATPAHLEKLVPLFNEYRIFYEQNSDTKKAKSFLQDRMDNNESVIFLAFEGEIAVGFTQLYPSFSSVSLQPVFILNDLYVKVKFRKKGIGEALLNYAKNFCREKGSKGLALETAKDNPARNLYERLGWKKDVQTFHYFWRVPL